ncbi:ABC transporter substrate-binding protein [bacterium]|nr:ABC transporter substrate-binding protein [bacterium]
MCNDKKILILCLVLSTMVVTFFSCQYKKKREVGSEITVLKVPITSMPDFRISRGNHLSTKKIIDNVYENLVNIDEALSPMPEIASIWKIDNKNNAIKFSIDKSKVFHDGERVTSKTILNAFLKMYEKNSAAVSQLKSLEKCKRHDYCEGFEIIDDFNFIIRIRNKNFSLLMKKLASTRAMIFREVKGSFLGTGPYKITSSNEKRTVLTKNDERANFESIVYTKMEPEEAYQNFLKKKVDTIIDIESNINLTELPQGVSSTQKVAGTYTLLFNLENSVFRNKQVRLAVAKTMNVSFISKVQKNKCIPAGGMIPQGYLGHTPYGYSINIAEAKRLIEKNVKLKDRHVNLGLRNRFKNNIKMHNYLVENFNNIGLNLSIEYLPYDKLNQKFRNRVLDMMYKGEALINYDPVTFFSGYLGTKYTKKFSGYENIKLVQLFEEYENITSRIEKLKILKKMQNIFFEDVPAIPLFYLVAETWYGPGLAVEKEKSLNLKFWDFSYAKIKSKS